MWNHRVRRKPRLEGPPDRGPRAARVPRLRLGRHRAPRGRRPRVRPRRRQAREAQGARRPEQLPRDDRRRPHALGDARRRERGQRAPAHRVRGRASSRSSSTASSRTTATSRTSSSRPATCSAPRRTPRSSRTCSRPSTTATCSRPFAPSTAGSTGHFTFVVIHHDEPNRLVGVRRETPMVVGLGDGENFLASNLSAFLSETRRVAYPADGVIVEVTPEAVRAINAADGSPVRARGGEDRLGRGGRGARGVRDVHAQGDLRAARRLRGDDRRSCPPRTSRPGRARHERGRPAQAAPDRHRRVRHGVPRRRRRPLRDRGVGPRPGRAGHRERVDLPQPGDRQGHARDRHLAVGRDARHDPGDEARPGARRPHGRDHEPDGLADHARGRLRPLHAHRSRGRRRGLEDLLRAGRAHVPDRARARAHARDAAARPRSSSSSTRSTACPQKMRAVPRAAAIRSTRSRSASTGSRSSSSSAATSVCPSRSRARSSSRRSPTSRPRRTPPAR